MPNGTEQGGVANKAKTTVSVAQESAKGRFGNPWGSYLLGRFVTGVMTIAIVVAVAGCGGSGPEGVDGAGGKKAQQAKRSSIKGKSASKHRLVSVSDKGIEILGQYSIGDSIDDAYKVAQQLDAAQYRPYLNNNEMFTLSVDVDANPLTDEGLAKLALSYSQIMEVFTRGYGNRKKESREIGKIRLATRALLMDGFDPGKIMGKLKKAKGMESGDIQHSDLVAVFAKDRYRIDFELVQKDGFNNYYYRIGDAMMSAYASGMSKVEYCIEVDGDYGNDLREAIRSEAAHEIEEVEKKVGYAKDRMERAFGSAMYGPKDQMKGKQPLIAKYEGYVTERENKLKALVAGTKEPTGEGSKVQVIRERNAYEEKLKKAQDLRESIKSYGEKIEEVQKEIDAFPAEVERIEKAYQADVQKIDSYAAEKLALIRSSTEEKMADLENKLNAQDHSPIAVPE